MPKASHPAVAKLAVARREYKEAVEQQAATAAILRTVSGAQTDLQPVFEVIAKSARQLLNGRYAVVVRRLGDSLHLVAHTATTKAGDKALEKLFPAKLTGQGATGKAVLTGKPAWIVDVETDPDYSPSFRAGARARGYRSQLTVPIVSKGDAIGAITVTRREPGEFSDQQIKLLQTFAAQAVIAIENVRLFNETKEALERQTATADVLKVISRSPTDVQPVLDAVAQRAGLLFGAIASSVFLAEGGVLRRRAIYGPRPGGRTSFDVPIRRSAINGRAFLDRRAVHVPDILRDMDEYPDAAVSQRRAGFRSMLSVPLIREGKAIGTIGVWRREVRPFTAPEIGLLETFADQAVIAIENTRLFNETKEALEHQKASADVLKIVAGSMESAQPVFEAIVAAGKRLLPDFRIGLNLVQDGVLHYAAHAGVSREQRALLARNFPLPIDRRTVVGTAVLRKRIVMVPDIAAKGLPYKRSIVTSRASGWRAMLAVPLMRDGKAIGALSISRPAHGPFSEKQVQIAQTFADQAVIAIQNARLFNETKEALDHQKASADVLKIVASSVESTDPVFRAITEAGMRLVPGCRVALHLLRDGHLHHVAHSGVTDKHWKKIAKFYPAPLRRPLPSSKAVTEKRVIHVPDIEKTGNEFALGRKIARISGWRAILAVPLLRGKEAIGNIAVTRVEPRPFSDKQIALMQTFADQAVIALRNSAMFNETKEALERQTATADILKVISSSPTDIKPVLRAVAESASRLCDASDVVIRRVDGDVMRVVEHIGEIDLDPEALARPIRTQSTSGRAIREVRTIHVPDVNDPEARKQYPEGAFLLRGAAPYRSLLTVPMARDGVAVGVIIVRRKEKRPFSEQQIKLLETFAAQAVIAIENVRLFNETKEALERQTATSEVLKTISRSTFDLDAVLRVLIENATRLAGAKQGFIFRSEDGRTARLAYSYNAPAAYREIIEPMVFEPGRDSLVGRVLLEQRPAYIPDVLADPDFTLHAAQRAGGFRSVFGVPMLRDGELIGVIAMWSPEVKSFTEQHTALVSTFADQAVIAIENVRLFTETKESLERQTATAEILKVIASSPNDVQPVFQVIVESAVQLCGARFGRVYRYEGSVIQMVASHGLSTGGLGQVKKVFPRPAAEDTIAGRVILARRPYFVKDIQGDDSVPALSRQMIEALGTRSQVTIPMLRAGESIGAITMGWAEPDAFDDQQVALLQTFADQAVIAIENVRLFNETKEALERQTATAEILRVISGSPTDVEPVLQAVAETAARLCGANDVVIRRVDGAELRLAAHFGPVRVATDSHALTRQSVGGRAVLDREAIHVDDITARKSRAEYSQAAAVQGDVAYRTILAVPLVRQDQAIGVILLRRLEIRPFTPQQVALLESFADQAVIAIENVRLFNETKEALERQTATADILKVISSSPTDVQPVFEAIVKASQRLITGKRSLLVVRRGSEFVVAAESGAGMEGVPAEVRTVPLDRETNFPSRAILDGEIVHIPDWQGEDVPPFEKLVSRSYGVRSGVIVPLLRNGVGIGALGVAREAPGAYGDQEISLLRSFADQAVIAIENVRLFNETKEALERQTATAEILKVISSSPTNVQPVFDAIVESAARLFDCRAGIVILEGESIDLKAVGQLKISDRDRGARLAEMRKFYPMPFDPERSYASRAIATRTAVLLDDTEAPEVAEFVRELGRIGGYRSFIQVPLIREDAGIGAIALTFEQPIVRLNDKQRALIQTFADQAVIAIENVRLFNETKEALERQTATAEILKVISSSTTDTQPVFEAIVRAAVRLFGMSNATIFMRDGDLIRLRAVEGATVNDAMRRELGSIYPIPFNPEVSTSARAMAERRINICLDSEAPDVAEHIRRAGHAGGFRSNTVVPLVREDEGIGTIVITHPEPGHRLNEKQLGLLRTFADQAVIAIENVRLFNETKEALEQQTATAEILRVISSTPTDTQPVFEAIAASALRIFGGMDVSVGVREGDAVRIRAGTLSSARKGVATLIPLNRDSCAGLAHLERVSFNIADIEAADTPPLTRERARATGWRSIALVPMLREGVAIGHISIHRQHPVALTEKQFALLRTFADQAVIAIENVRLFNETKASLERQTATSEILGVISRSPTDVQPVFDAVAKNAAQLCGASNALVWRLEGEELRLVTIHWTAPDEPDADRQHLKMKVGDRIPLAARAATARAVVERSVIHIPDISEASEEEFGDTRERAAAQGFRALLAVPLMRGEGEAVGVIFIRRTQAGRFAAEHIALLRTFADQAAIAIENVRLFNELKEKSRQLEEASQHKSQFLASMSHELRTPLNAILGFNEMIIGQVYGDVPADMQEPLKDIQTSGKHLLRLINNVLDLAKIEAGRMELALADYSVQDMVESVRSTLRPLAAEKGLEFFAHVPAGLPLGHGDGGRLTQCLMNLAGNSLKFTKAGKVEIGAAHHDDRIRFHVADTGIGIPPEKIASLFTEFKQSDATIASEYGGTGLGLSITKKFVEMHGGRIWIESELGKGSTFLFEVPLRVAK